MQRETFQHVISNQNVNSGKWHYINLQRSLEMPGIQLDGIVC